MSSWFVRMENDKCTPLQGPHSLILLTGGGPKEFWAVWNFSQKGLFGVAKKHRNFGGIVFTSAQINNNVSVICCLCGIFLGMLKK